MAEETTATTEETEETEETGSEETETTEEKTAEDYRKELRRYERSAKQGSAKKDKEIEKLKADLTKREDADKSEQDRAVEKAREEARTEALTEAQKDRRTDRLEASVIRLASKGVTVGEGDDAKTVKFADPEDALVFIERAISRGDLDEDTIFDSDNKPVAASIEEALVDLLERKPRLGESDEDETVRGGADGGRGAGAGTSLDDMSTADHLKALQKK